MLEYFDKVSASVKIPSNGSYTNGIWGSNYPSSGITISIIAPQPLMSFELEMLDEGERTKHHLKTWIETEILPRQALKDSAIITYDSKNFLVTHVDDWNTEGNFYRIIMKEITSDESGHRL